MRHHALYPDDPMDVADLAHIVPGKRIEALRDALHKVVMQEFPMEASYVERCCLMQTIASTALEEDDKHDQ